MSGIVNPIAAFEMWSDHPQFVLMKRMLHPSLCDLWIKDVDDATVCMAALVAMIRCSDLVISHVTEWDVLRGVLARCYAVAEACGRIPSAYTTGERTVVRFELQSVNA